MAFSGKCRRGIAVTLFVTGFGLVAAFADEALRYELIVTSSRQRFTDVQVRAFDPRTGRVTILCREGMANLSLEDFPEEDRVRIREGRRLDNRLTAGSPQSLRVVVKERIAEGLDAGTATDPGSLEGRVEKAVRSRAQGYFKFSYTPKGMFHHCTFEVSSKPPVEIAGWTGRYLAEGDATYTFFSANGQISGTEIVGWEADVQVRDGEVTILDFKNH
ncbi:hypothetical protein [Nibricoccus sp. IMCC34717]|uniref:hypothetical protein n=1 Tax=Nibricoccus sp. IMCC34717 TaxID=3034021 RepID=UPI00384D5818